MTSTAFEISEKHLRVANNFVLIMAPRANVHRPVDNITLNLGSGPCPAAGSLGNVQSTCAS